MNYAESPYLRALIRKYEYERDTSIAVLRTFFENPVGVADHSNFVETMDKHMRQLCEAEECLRSLINNFAQQPQPQPQVEPQKEVPTTEGTE
tara:strand:- start:5949 stop:6224 length:276 start_codon:yes stop_codon:yes gene_type:complete